MPDITTLIGRENCGFTIQIALPVGKFAYVLAYSEENRCTPWVTWLWSPYGNGFGMGHYHIDEYEALADVYERAYNEAQSLLGRHREHKKEA